MDDLTTLLALALQTPLGSSEPAEDIRPYLLNPGRDRLSLLLTLAAEMGLLRKSDGRIRPTRAAVSWLKLGREAQLHALADAWSKSNWNELRHTPELVCEGESWQNDPILARTALLDALPRSPEWFRLADLVAHIKQSDPDFQRPDGNYDTWYIREVGRDEYYTGFSAWDEVEGRLLRFLVQGPLYWLGMAEVAGMGATDGMAYRLTPRALDWLAAQPPPQEEAAVPLIVQADGRILVPLTSSRYHRFQAARIAEAQPATPGKPYVYRLTPHSLAAAREQGISPERLLQFLAEASRRQPPKSVRRAIMRWAEHGVEGRLETAVILRVSNATIIETLRNNPKTRDYLGESLGDFAVVVRRDRWQEFRTAVAQLGLLLDSKENNE